jgi:selenocysteine lyase/cysteine desulfurase
MPPLWEEVRLEFPGLSSQAYLNAAATAPTPRPVRAAVDRFYRELEGEGDGAWDAWMERREAVRSTVARFIGAEADEVAFAPNTSTGMNLIVDLLGEDGAVLSDELEFPAVTLPWVHRGIPVHLLPAVEGRLRLESFAAEHSPQAGTIAISHVQFSNGCRQDLDAFGRVKAGRRLVVCASQSMGAFPIDVKRSGIDALATAGHKWLCAGFGAGFFYVHRDILAARPPRAIGWLSGEDPFAFDPLHCQILPSNRRTELGCPPFAQIFALGAAVDFIAGIGIDEIAERILALNMYLTFRLGRAGIEVLSPGGEHRSGETLCAVAEPARAVAYLKAQGIAVTPKPQGLRIATHFFNHERDVDRCVEALVGFRKTL